MLPRPLLSLTYDSSHVTKSTIFPAFVYRLQHRRAEYTARLLSPGASLKRPSRDRPPLTGFPRAALHRCPSPQAWTVQRERVSSFSWSEPVGSAGEQGPLERRERERETASVQVAMATRPRRPDVVTSAPLDVLLRSHIGSERVWKGTWRSEAGILVKPRRVRRHLEEEGETRRVVTNRRFHVVCGPEGL